MEHMKFESPDLTAGNVEKIAALFPNCVTEMLDEEHSTKDKKVYKKAINFDMLRQMLSGEVVEGDEAYEFTWVGKKASIVEANRPIRKTLRPCPEESVDWDTTENLYIEGDNLEVLKLLQESYLGKIKLIYIDPPYNTGSDRFVYSDDFALDKDEYFNEIGVYDEDGNVLFAENNSSNPRFHSAWCHMIYSRLLLARSLLTEDGVIFISIDDNELSNVIKICDEVFGNSNFISLLSVENNPKGRKNSNYISVSNDFCLVYGKNKEKGHFVENVPKDVKDLTKDEDGNYVHSSGKRVLVGENSFNRKITDFKSEKHYSVYYHPENRKMVIRKEANVLQSDKALTRNGYVRYFSHCDGSFVENTYTIKKFQELFDAGKVEFKNGKIYEKNMSTTIRLKSMLVNKAYEAVINGEVKSFAMDFKTTSAGTALKELFETSEPVFSAAKNTSFIKTIITLMEDNDCTVMDFFSGSSTTAHAVMMANSEDGGKRKYIMVQIPEKCAEKSVAAESGFTNICEIGKERIRRAGAKIKADNPLTTQDLDVGFRVFKVDDTNMEDVYYSPSEYTQEMLAGMESNIKPDRSDLDLLFGCLLDWGLPLSLPYHSENIDGCTVHTYAPGDAELGVRDALIACFDSNVPESVIKEIARRNPLRAVFRDSGFATSPEKINVEEIFAMLAPDTKVRVI